MMKKLKLVVSEPFGFPLNFLEVAVHGRQNEKLLLATKDSIQYKDHSIHQFLAVPRNSKESFDLLSNEKTIEVNITPILSEQTLSFGECIQFELKWRGWFLLGTLRSIE